MTITFVIFINTLFKLLLIIIIITNNIIINSSNSIYNSSSNSISYSINSSKDRPPSYS